ncbi:hypothetical protein FZCC0188_11705 [Rhodobacterales bacterium FZCC0188]|nr:hypothetical protein [Rhodobacterales bacterium FZCC0188]
MANKFFLVRGATSVEVILIAFVLLVLPLFEAPKNVFSVLFLIVWGGYAIRGHSLGRSSPFDLLILCLSIILWLPPLFANSGDTIVSTNSAHRWTLLALFVLAVSRLDYTRLQVTVMLAALMVGGMAAVAESFWVWSMNGKPYPEFRSVGHVNHSSMYSLIPLAAGIGALYLRERWMQVLSVATILSTLAFLPPSKSLTGGVSITVILIVGLSVWAVRRWALRGLVLAVLAASIVVMGVLASPPASGFRDELVSRVNSHDPSSGRVMILNSALAVWDRHPLFGTGWYTFGSATSEEEVRAALAEDGREYNPNEYAHHSHGHNLWTTTLIERGVLGVVLFSVLLALYLRVFLPLTLDRQQLDRSDRGIAVMALLVAVGFSVAGLGNTTMMNEHGQAGMTLIAICYGCLRGRGRFAAF